jgi:hypothetical protein
MLTEGVWAEVEVAGEHLRLFSEQNAQGIQASVYSVKTRTWIAPSEPVDDIEKGKDRAEEIAKTYLKTVASLDLPPLKWKESRARQGRMVLVVLCREDGVRASDTFR